MKKKISTGKTEALSRAERTTLKTLLAKVPPAPRIPFDLFIPIMSKGVTVTIEAAVVRGGRMLLVYRDDAYYTGWHFPGKFLSPRESFDTACNRVVRDELGVKLLSKKFLSIVNYMDDPRFHSVSVPYLCIVEGKPYDGRWFSSCPKNIIPIHRELWDVVARSGALKSFSK